MHDLHKPWYDLNRHFPSTLGGGGVGLKLSAEGGDNLQALSGLTETPACLFWRLQNNERLRLGAERPQQACPPLPQVWLWEVEPAAGSPLHWLVPAGN